MVKKFAKHAPDQIVCKLAIARELEEGEASMTQVLAEPSIGEATLDRWQSAYGRTSRTEARKPARLRKENSDPKRLPGQAELEKLPGIPQRQRTGNPRIRIGLGCVAPSAPS